MIDITKIKFSSKFIEKNENIENKIKLFDELVISEFDLSLIIKNYVFPFFYYHNQLKKIGILDKDINKVKLIKENSNKIKFRTKNIIFMGYDSKENNKYYFLQLTSKRKDDWPQSLYMINKLKNKEIFINTSKIYYFNLNKQHVFFSKFINKKIKIQFKKVISYSILSTVLFLIPFIVIIEQHWGKTLNSVDWVVISFLWVYSIWNSFHNYGNILVLKEDYPDIPNKLINELLWS